MKQLLLLGILLTCILSSCRRNNIQEHKAWSPIFTKYGIDSACFELADNSHEQVYYYNLNRLSRRFSPASTFKIVNSLVALETNIAPDENMMLTLNDSSANRPECQQDMTMREAFKLSCLNYYQELARRIGPTEMQKWLDTLHYGNARIGNTIDAFWINDTLLISADEQVGFMKKLYFDKLPFSQRTQRIVRSMMLREDSSSYRLYYKTGTLVENQKSMAWLVGFVERKEVQKGVLTKKEETNYKPYFFALNIESADTSDALQVTRLAILKDLLRERQIIP
jgi:beta-lactamase class D